jgi:phage N-6-adenine-methyltransferase
MLDDSVISAIVKTRMPAQRPSRSRQDYRTPAEFLDAVRHRLRINHFACDLAAADDNAVAEKYYTEAMDALDPSNGWKVERGGWNWCNPPYADLAPWVQKAHEYSINTFTQTAMLVPASVGANWWRDWVHDKAHVLFLNGRISFDGIAPYPKDCALLLYTPHTRGGYEIWNWRESRA